MKTKHCSACGLPKKLAEYGKNCKSPGGRLARCKACDREIRISRYHSNPAVRGGFIWSAILQRVGNANGKNASYSGTAVTFTRDKFITWYAAALPRFFAKYGDDAKPSIDRKDQAGHYSPGNVRLIPMGENSKRARNKRNLRAPVGKAWCTHCRDYLPRTDFYKNKAQQHGLTHSCKKHFKRASLS